MSCCGDPRCEANNPCRNYYAKTGPKKNPGLDELREEQKKWAMSESDECRTGIVKRYIWTTTYREMNKDGAALPIGIKCCPPTAQEKPPGDQVLPKKELAPRTLFRLDEVFEKWDRPQVRKMAERIDTMYNRPDLSKDSYFQEHRLCRAKYARCPEAHDVPTKENLELAKSNRLRQPYDKMIPGYGGYECFVTPPVCKVKKILDPSDPYEKITKYQEDYIKHPTEAYSDPVAPVKPEDFDEAGIATNPISTLAKLPLACTKRLSCYLECNWDECPKDSYKIPNCGSSSD